MKIVKYPDGTSYVNDTELHDKVFRINTYEDLHHLEQFVDAFQNKFNTNPSILIPNLIDAQADKRFNVGESSGLKIVLKRLASLKARFEIFHPHNEEVVMMGMELLENPVTILDNSFFISYILKKYLVGMSHDIKTGLIIMSTDAGGFKPLMKMCDKIGWEGETESASKSREYVDGKTKLVQKIDREDFEGKDILIVDDLMSRGGTFIGLAKLLRERNVGKLFLAVSHITVEMLNPEVFRAFDFVYTTNSKGYDYKMDATGHDEAFGVTPDNLEVIKLF